MKKILTATMVLSVLCALAVPAFAEETTDDGIAFGMSLDFNSKYIWRGQNLSDDYVFQPGITATMGSITAGIWGNWDMTSINENDKHFSEVDYSLDYSGDLTDGISYSIGVIYYDFPGTELMDTTELYWGFAFDLPLSPSVTVYHDVDEAEGTYVSLGLGHSIEKIATLGEDTSVGMDIGASLGWGSSSYNDYYWGVDSDEWNDFTVSVSFPMELAGWSFAPSVNYVAIVSDDLKATNMYRSESDYFYTGLSLSKEF